MKFEKTNNLSNQNTITLVAHNFKDDGKILNTLKGNTESILMSDNDLIITVNIFQLARLKDLLKAEDLNLNQIYEDERIIWEGPNFKFDLTVDPLIYSIFNFSPDSFSTHVSNETSAFLRKAEDDLQNGAKVLEIGGKSTRPGFTEITVDEEWERIEKPLKILKKEFPNVPISVDTYNVEVMRRSLENGADIINDINGFETEEKIDLLKQYDVGAVAMLNNRLKHETDIDSTLIENHFKELLTQIDDKNIPRNRFSFDLGVGFSENSSLADDLVKINAYSQLSKLNVPLMIAISRKSFIQKILDSEADRVTISLFVELLMTLNNGRILRVHDVKETQYLLNLLKAIVID